MNSIQQKILQIKQTYATTGYYTLEQIIEVLDLYSITSIYSAGLPLSNIKVSKISPLDTACETSLSFFAHVKYKDDLEHSIAQAILVNEQDSVLVGDRAIIVADPYLAYAQLSHLFSPLFVEDDRFVSLDDRNVINDAFISLDAHIGTNCRIGKGCVISQNVHIGDHCIIMPNVTIYPNVHIGNNVTIHSGSVIGADGFGFAPSKNGWVKIAQIGGVIIEDNVDIGANVCVDSGALEATQIKQGVIIDNFVQVAHNVVIGERTAIAGQAGIAGSTKIGSDCMIAGQAGIAGHISVVDKSFIGMQAQVTSAVKKPGSYASGTGLFETSAWRKVVALLRRMSKSK